MPYLRSLTILGWFSWARVFASAVNFAVGHTPSAVAAADFDGDGDADLAVASHGDFDDPDLDDVSILINDGAGSFSTAATLAVGVNPRAIATGDVDGDADVDLVISNYGTGQETSTIAVLAGNGDGTFAAAVNWPTGWAPQDVVLGDFDGDGDLDAATANYGSSDVSLLANDGSGGFGNG